MGAPPLVKEIWSNFFFLLTGLLFLSLPLSFFSFPISHLTLLLIYRFDSLLSPCFAFPLSFRSCIAFAFICSSKETYYWFEEAFYPLFLPLLHLSPSPPSLSLFPIFYSLMTETKKNEHQNPNANQGKAKKTKERKGRIRRLPSFVPTELRNDAQRIHIHTNTIDIFLNSPSVLVLICSYTPHLSTSYLFSPSSVLPSSSLLSFIPMPGNIFLWIGWLDDLISISYFLIWSDDPDM